MRDAESAAAASTACDAAVALVNDKLSLARQEHATTQEELTQFETYVKEKQAQAGPATAAALAAAATRQPTRPLAGTAASRLLELERITASVRAEALAEDAEEAVEMVFRV